MPFRMLTCVEAQWTGYQCEHYWLNFETPNEDELKEAEDAKGAKVELEDPWVSDSESETELESLPADMTEEKLKELKASKREMCKLHYQRQRYVD